MKKLNAIFVNLELILIKTVDALRILAEIMTNQANAFLVMKTPTVILFLNMIPVLQLVPLLSCCLLMKMENQFVKSNAR